MWIEKKNDNIYIKDNMNYKRLRGIENVHPELESVDRGAWPQ